MRAGISLLTGNAMSGKGRLNKMRIAKIERKIEYLPIIGGEVKATNDAQGIIEGYLNYIGNIDYGDDRTMKGAFKKTLTDSYARKSAQDLDFLWPYLWNHDYTQLPPGGIFDADETPKGLYTKTQFNLDIQVKLRLRVERSEEHTSELQSHLNLVCRLLLEKKKKTRNNHI